MRCTVDNARTSVRETVHCPDGSIRRRRECTQCGRRFTSLEYPAHAAWLPEFPEQHPNEGALEAHRRRLVFDEVRRENERKLHEALGDQIKTYKRMIALLEGATKEARS